MIPYGRQEITAADIEAVTAVLKSDFLTQGPAVPRFETALCEVVGVQHAVAVNSATSALHVACLALGLGKGDRLWTSPNTFVASANCALYCGAEVDFVDIDPATANLSVERLREKLEQAAHRRALPKILVPVHFAGQPTAQEAIWELAREYGFFVIEDASHSVGASRNGENVGSCRWSHITVFSFHPVKIITSAEGGMAVTNDAALARRMALLRSHGITREAGEFVSADARDSGAWYYEQQHLGFNYRMTDVHAALGQSQLLRLSGYVERRNQIARRYDDLLAELPLTLPGVEPQNRSAFHLYVVRLQAGGDRATHLRIFNELRRRDMGVNLHYMPVHLQPYYRALGFSPGDFPQAEAFAAAAITLPLYATLTEADQDLVVSALHSVLVNA
jgi:UDP-4-amino-4,6-dideoxy-N-acetyl-beta-L-altrosamine transaminase